MIRGNLEKFVKPDGTGQIRWDFQLLIYHHWCYAFDGGVCWAIKKLVKAI